MGRNIWASAATAAFLIASVGAKPASADIISGRMVDGAARPVAGVRVALSQLGISATTGADGRFSLTTPTSGLVGATPGEAGLSLETDRLRITRLRGGRREVYTLDGRRVVAAAGLPEAKPALLGKRAARPVAPDTLVCTLAGWFSRRHPLAAPSTQDVGDVSLRKDPIVVKNTSQDQYNQIIVETVDKRIDSTFYMIIKAMIVIESSFNAKAISMYDVTLPCGTHSYGLIQVTPGCIKGYATLPAGTPVTATISGGLSGNPAKLTYANPADQASGNTIVMENNIVINLVSNPANPHWPTSGFNPAYNIDYGARTMADLRTGMKNKFKGCTEANYVAMSLAGYNQGSGTVTGCTAFSANGTAYAGKVLDQYRRFCTAAGIAAIY